MGWKNNRTARNKSYLTRYAMEQIMERGRYIGLRPVSRFRRMRDSVGNWETIDWIKDFLERGIIQQENLSINWAYPNRPIQIVLDETSVTEDMIQQAKRAGAARAVSETEFNRSIQKQSTQIEVSSPDPEDIRKLSDHIGKLLG